MFKKLAMIIVLCSCLTQSLFAQEKMPLRIAVPHFLPPFVIEGVDHNLSGFDIILMQHLCQILQRNCKFFIMDLNDILPSVKKQKVDVGIGHLVITADLYKQVDFTIPYILSESRFLTTQNSNIYTTDLQVLQNKKIGVQASTVYAEQLQQMGHMTSNIVILQHQNDIMDALNNGDIDVALLSNSNALYWANQSANQLRVIGEPILYGFGAGIAVNPTDPELTQELNAAILRTQQSAEYKEIFHMYFGKMQ